MYLLGDRHSRAEFGMDARKAVILSQGFTILAMLLLVSARVGDAPENAPRLFGVDTLLIGVVAVLLLSSSIVTYILRTSD
jgi:hypothetical protein